MFGVLWILHSFSNCTSFQSPKSLLNSSLLLCMRLFFRAYEIFVCMFFRVVILFLITHGLSYLIFLEQIQYTLNENHLFCSHLRKILEFAPLGIFIPPVGIESRVHTIRKSNDRSAAEYIGDR